MDINEDGMFCDMSVSELITALEKIPNKETTKVMVQYRDGGGDYCGTDDIIYMTKKTYSDGTECIIL